MAASPQEDEITNLAQLLKENGDQILNATSKLSLSTTLLKKLNDSFENFSNSETCRSSFHVAETFDIVDSFLDLHFLYDFIQKTLALKILPGCDVLTNKYFVDINLFSNLKLLEVHRFSTNLIKGIKSLRTQLEYLTCMRSLNTLKDVLENCGADKCQGFVWSELKEAVFSHNGLNSLDGSLEFAPSLNTLDLSHNRIQNAEPLNCLSNLKYLNLSYNHLESLPIFTGNLCNSLRILVLSNNYIDDIKDIAILSNLKELDLSDNCLFEHNALESLSYLGSLECLFLTGNPLSFHTQHRILTAKYLHINTANINFKLDNIVLSKSEQRVVGFLHPVHLPLERSSSFNSTTTANTVIPAYEKNLQTQKFVQHNKEFTEDNVFNEITTINDNLGMQDSGFVAGPRPASPSECSIGSAASLTSDMEEKSLKHYESDIEVISNPSQSSIEVLGSGSAYIRYSASALTIQTIYENNDLNNVPFVRHRLSQ